MARVSETTLHEPEVLARGYKLQDMVEILEGKTWAVGLP